MSYTYYNDYTTSDYWDPVLYPKSDIYSSLIYEKIRKCVREDGDKIITPVSETKRNVQNDTKEILYCDISDSLRRYNEFLKKYTAIFNKIITIYNEISVSITSMRDVDPVVDKWLQWVKQLHKENVEIKKIEQVQITHDVTKLIVCDEVVEIIKTMIDDINERMKILNKISDFDVVDPRVLWNTIYTS
jgi:DNA-directed RNA polymerase beta' subunit